MVAHSPRRVTPPRTFWLGAVFPCLLVGGLSAQPSSPPRGVAQEALPGAVLRAVDDLYRLGLGDPNQGQYREIEIPMGTHAFGGKVKPLRTRGWVLPSNSPDAVASAVCWDGIVRKVESVGPPANLDADLAVILSPSPDALSRRMEISGNAELVQDRLTLGKLPLLIRLGRMREAVDTWNRWEELNRTGAVPRWESRENLPSPFVVLATEWIFRKYRLAQLDHQEGRHEAALAGLEDVLRLRNEIEKTAALHEGRTSAIDLHLLDAVPALIADQQRRLAEKSSDRAIAGETAVDKRRRIAHLIRDLQDVRGERFTPGYVNFANDPAVLALVKQGEDAVEPLIDCVEKDRRLTRSIDDGGGRGAGSGRFDRVIGVEEPAIAALKGILKVRDQFPSLDLPNVNASPVGPKVSREELAAFLRTYWKQNKDRSLPERWYALLADDQTRPEVWAEVAENLVRPESQPVVVYGLLMNVVARGPIETDPLRGEPLRGKTNPSISDLMVKRLDQVSQNETGRETRLLHVAQKLSAALVAWDGKNQIDVLQRRCEELRNSIAAEDASLGLTSLLDLLALFRQRLESGDKRALTEYAEWLRGADAKKLSELGGSYGAFFLAPLWRYPSDPDIAALTQWVFIDPASPWSRGDSAGGPSWLVTSIRTPLMTVPAFRQRVEGALGNMENFGRVEITENNVLVHSGYGGSAKTDPEVPPTGFTQDLRVCDQVACALSQIPGAPRCEPYWPLERRNQAVAEATEFLRQYGNRITSARDDQNDGFVSDLELRFPRLDGPATEQDVLEGKAIFALKDGRTFSMPDLPRPAHWITFKNHPQVGMWWHENGDPVGERLTYDHRGMVWQAEEVRTEGGDVKRTFGFVAKNGLHQVPGDELQFEAPGFSVAAGSWGLRVDLPRPERFRRGDPITVSIILKNLLGRDRQPPASFLQGNDAAQGASPAITIRLRHTARSRDELSWRDGNPDLWPSQASRGPVTLKPKSLPARMNILQEATLLEFDVAPFFDLEAGATYSVEIEFSGQGSEGFQTVLRSPLFEISE